LFWFALAVSTSLLSFYEQVVKKKHRPFEKEQGNFTR